MFNRYLIATAILTLSVNTCIADNKAHWSYAGKTGPNSWGNLSEEFQTCKLWTSQSPLDIKTSVLEKVKSSSIKTSYKSSAGELVNNGHTIQINLADGGSANLGGKDYKILQCHFHTPSEEKINGKNYPLNVRLVHKSNDGKLGVIGIFIQEGKGNAALKNIFANLPPKEGISPLTTNFDVATLLASSMAFYHYSGSLTTPPCSEGVSFYILKTPIEMSKAQIDAFRKIFSLNAAFKWPQNYRI